MNNYIPGSSSYPSHFNSPVSSSHYNDYNSNNNNNNNHNNYGSSIGGGGGGSNGFMDDMGYLTPSPVISNNDYNRPPSRPPTANGYNDYQDDGNGYSYGSYQGKERK